MAEDVPLSPTPTPSELPVPVEKIKKEKVTPPPSPKPELDEIISTLFHTENSQPGDDDTTQGDHKRSMSPVKTSDEILMELFQVFNSAPPGAAGKKSHKKHKKHKKKSKKRKSKNGLSDVSDSESDLDDAANGHKLAKKVKKEKDVDAERPKKIKKEKDPDAERAKKIKKEKDPDSSRPIKREDDPDGHSSSRKVKVKKERRSRSREKDRSEPERKKSEKSAAERDKSDGRIASKIVIMDLKNSKIFSEAGSNQSRESTKDRKSSSSRKHRDSRRSSSLSLSDEETYERERNSRKRESGFSTNKSSRQHRDDFRSSYRQLSRDSRDGPRLESDRDMRERIDKKKLLEIARKNAMTMLKNGALPGITTMRELQRARYGGKSIDELTDFCKKLSNGEVLTDLSSVSSGDSDHDREGNSKAFHHPFILKDRGPIVLNIRNAIPIPTRTVDQTKAILQQFPVSSGQEHRQTEMEWVPVVKPKAIEAPPPATKKAPEAILPAPPPQTSVPTAPPAVALSSAVNSVAVVPPPMTHPPAFITYPSLKSYGAAMSSNASMEPLQPPPTPQGLLSESVFNAPSEVPNLDVSSIITQRLNAMRKLQENPNDSDAINLMENTQKDMSSWAASKFTPGKFLGSTGANILSVKQLQSGGNQAWAKRDAFTSSTPLSGGKGMALLQKMGWNPGEALGKEKTGSLEPLLLEVKLDRKGLIATEEDHSNRKRKGPPTKGIGGSRNMKMSQQFMESKHPVSLLGELASKKKWGAPQYEVVHESGPGHHKCFVYQVILNGMAYTPTMPSTTKKEAKKMAAQVCLEQMGVLSVSGPDNQ